MKSAKPVLMMSSVTSVELAWIVLAERAISVPSAVYAITVWTWSVSAEGAAPTVP